MAAMLRQLHPELWVAETPLRFLGLEVGSRMTVVRLPGGGLLLHSPIAANNDLFAEVKDLGEVRCLVAPNRFHHLAIGDWKAAFPEAAMHVAPGLERKRPDLAVDGVLGAKPDKGWADVLDQVLVEGIPMISEVAFFHRPSATLLATDLAFHLGRESPLSTQLFIRATGTFGKLGPTVLEKLLARDRAALRRSLERILAWPFERVIVAHGPVCESGGREQLVEGYDWVLRS